MAFGTLQGQPVEIKNANDMVVGELGEIIEACPKELVGLVVGKTRLGWVTLAETDRRNRQPYDNHLNICWTNKENPTFKVRILHSQEIVRLRNTN